MESGCDTDARNAILFFEMNGYTLRELQQAIILAASEAATAHMENVFDTLNGDGTVHRDSGSYLTWLAILTKDVCAWTIEYDDLGVRTLYDGNGLALANDGEADCD